jgi:hypothetical protein
MSGYLTVDEAIENAPADLKEKDVEDVFGGKVRIRSLTAHQAARVKQLSLNLKGKTPDVAWAEMEKAQFELGVIEPKFNRDAVEKLHRTSGPSFAKVIAELDSLSGTDKEELRKAQDEFQDTGE